MHVQTLPLCFLAGGETRVISSSAISEPGVDLPDTSRTLALIAVSPYSGVGRHFTFFLGGGGP